MATTRVCIVETSQILSTISRWYKEHTNAADTVLGSTSIQLLKSDSFRESAQMKSDVTAEHGLVTSQPMVLATSRPRRLEPLTQDQQYDASKEVDDDDDDYTSSSGSSEDEEEEEAGQSEHEDQSATQTKSIPVITQRNTEIRSRLFAFLPQIERSNRELQAQDDSNRQRIDNVDDNAEHYIEMNLGLGVLSQLNDDKEAIRLKDAKFESAARLDEQEDPTLVAVEKLKVQEETTRKRKIQEL